MREEHGDAQDALRAQTDKLMDARHRRAEANSDYRKLVDPVAAPAYRGERHIEEDHPSAIFAKEKLDRRDKEIQELNQQYKRREERFKLADRRLRVVEEWLKAVPRDAEIVPAEAPKISKGETLDSVTAKIQALYDELRNVEDAPFPASEAKAAARSHIEALATAGAPDITRLLQGGDKIAFPSIKAEIPVVSLIPRVEGKLGDAIGHPHAKVHDTLGVLCWMYRDDLLDRIDAEIDQRTDHANAIPSTEREERADKIVASILDLEHREAAICRRDKLELRPDLDPRAVLAVEIAE